MARSKKGISSVVSGAGMLTSIFTLLDQAVRAQGATDEDWHRLTTPEGRMTIEAMADAFMERRLAEQTEKYPITVDYGRSKAQMVAAGRYDYVNPNITEKNFPVTGSGVVETDCVLVHPNRYIDSEAAESEIVARGLRPATHEELLAFGEKYPDVQRQFPIVALGSVWTDSRGDRRVPCLWGPAGGRRLSLDLDEVGWRPACSFLAARKKK